MLDAVSTLRHGDPAAVETSHPDLDPHAALERHSAAPWFVWGIWGLMLLGHVAIVLRSTSPFPWADEADLLLGPLTPGWLWQQYTDHRVPLAKLLWLGGLKLTGYDFRAVAVFSVLCVAATAAAMIVGAARLRGRARYTDAFFPLAMLSFGQVQNFLWTWVLNHILPNLVACALLLVVAFRAREPRLGASLLVAAVLGLLYLCGPVGLPYILAFAAWLGYRGARLWWSPAAPGDRRDGLVALGLAAASVALLGLYFIGFKPRSANGGIPVHETGLGEQLKASIRILSASFGQPVTPYVRPVALVLLGLILAGTAMLVRTWLRQPTERSRALGLLLFLGGTVALLLAVGRVRAGWSWQWQLWGVYMNMAIPALCAIYLTGILYGRPAVGELTQATLFTLSCLFFLPNLQRAVDFSHGWQKHRPAIERDIQAGVPASLLAERRHDDLGIPLCNYLMEKLLAQRILNYKELAIPQFRAVADDPVYREVRLPITTAALDGVAWEDDVAYSCCRFTEDASLAFLLNQPRFVYAVRLRCAYDDEASGIAEPKIVWSVGESGETPDGEGTVETGRETLVVNKIPAQTREGKLADLPVIRVQTVTFWVNSKIDRFRIYPDTKPFAFKIVEVTLLARPDDAPAGKPKMSRISSNGTSRLLE
jgi:hypothetical protein